jgi:protein-S-isoprenylcysteine O-methyltransferase Ste14
MAHLGEVSWVVGIITWYIIRYPFERRARRVKVVRSDRSVSEVIGLTVAFVGLAIIPSLYVATGFPSAADYPTLPSATISGIFFFFMGLCIFRRSHKDLGKNWSITLAIRDRHKLVSTGVYAFIRHPMYTSFLLIAVGQALLLPNWVAGPAGLVGFFVLFGLRVEAEERMMLEAFGAEYRAYAARTKRIIPYVY